MAIFKKRKRKRNSQWWNPKVSKRSPAITLSKQKLIKPEHKIFTMGSCFANEVRYALEEKGYDIVPKNYYITEGCQKRNIKITKERAHLQFYNTFSIRQEVEKALGLWKQDPDDYWNVKVDNEAFCKDPYRRYFLAKSVEELHGLTSQIDEALKHGMEGADLFIFTLGLTEVWEKKDNGKIACTAPAHGEQDALIFRQTSFEENYANMKQVIKLIQEFDKPKDVVLTVSPVSLMRTYRDMDVRVANMESKSILRAVAGQIASEHANVHYFPSYEMLMYWQSGFRKDGRHVKWKRVQHIMDTFLEHMT